MVQLLLQRAQLLAERVGVLDAHLLGDLVVPVEQRLGLGDALLDVLQDVLALVELGFLQEDADGVAGAQRGIAVGRLLQTRHDLQDGGLARTVRADHADLRARQEREGHVVEDDLVAVGLPRLAQGVDELRHVYKLSARGAGLSAH